MEEEYNNIVSIHAGQEHAIFQTTITFLFARKFIEVAHIYFMDIIRMYQGIEEINGSLIAYSLEILF